MINEEFLTLCGQLIAIDSTPAKGNYAAAAFLRDVALKLGFAAKLQPATVDGVEHANLIVRDPARPEGPGAGEVLFQTHLDTVFPGPYEKWTRCGGDPFKATIDGDIIYGLGTADVKLDFLCKLFALKNLLGKNLRRPFVLVGTYLEELDMDGVKHLLSSGEVTPSMAVVGEPSEMNIVHGNNGYGTVTFEVQAQAHTKPGMAVPDSSKLQKLEFHGKAVHSSVPHLGENAIYKLAEHLKTLSLDEEIVRVGAGSGPNTVPSHAWVELRKVGAESDPNAYSRVLRTVILKMVAEIQGLAAVTRRYQNQMFEPSHPTWNMAQLIQDEKGLKIVVSFRVVPGVEQDSVDEWIDRLRSQARLVQARMKFSGWTPPVMTPLQSELVVNAQAVCAEFKLPTQPIRKVSTTEMSFLGQKKIPAIVIGPGVSQGNSHTANEHNRITQLELAMSYYKKLAERLCL